MDSSPPTPSGSADRVADWEVDTARAVVRSFVAARGPFAMHDFEDLVQECLFHWWERRDRYSADWSAKPRTFMNRVLTNKLRDLRRAERAEKRRAAGEALSLDAPLGAEGEDLGSLAALLRDDSTDARPEQSAERAEVRERIERVRRGLTGRQQALLDGVDAGQSMTELHRLLGAARSTLYDELERIKAEFEAEGLRDFLD